MGLLRRAARPAAYRPWQHSPTLTAPWGPRTAGVARTVVVGLQRRDGTAASRGLATDVRLHWFDSSVAPRSGARRARAALSVAHGSRVQPAVDAESPPRTPCMRG